MNTPLCRVMAAAAVTAMAVAVTSCREEQLITKPQIVPVTPPALTEVSGFYLLNEGNMGSNKSTLDYWDASTGDYHRNIYAAANPTVPKELGDVGNDLAIRGSRLYAVINCSNKVEIMDAATARKLGQVDIPNCRHIAFGGRYAYVTSYAGPVEITENYRQRGYVARIDTATMAVVDTVIVGYQPDGIAVSGGKAYVANSGGYMVPRYERTLSVIDLEAMKVEKTVDVAVNLNHVVADGKGRIWVSSRGDYYNSRPALYCYDPAADRIVADIGIAVGSMWLDGELLYIVGSAFSYAAMATERNFAVVDTESFSIITRNFITDGTDSRIRVPYGVAVNPAGGEIYVTDALNYVNPGQLYCFSPEGVLLWEVRTGDVPSRFAFTGR